MRQKPTADECVYCNLQLTIEEGVELLDVVTALRAAGTHPNLSETFRWMAYQLKDSIESAADDSHGLLSKPKPKH
jgi:hypothetical protein